MLPDYFLKVVDAIRDADEKAQASLIAEAITSIDAQIERLNREKSLIRQMEETYASYTKPPALEAHTNGSDDEVTSDDGFSSKERGDKVRQAALDLARGGMRNLTPNDVLGYLGKHGIRFSVARPASMVASVLMAMPEFKKTEAGKYKYVEI